MQEADPASVLEKNTEDAQTTPEGDLANPDKDDVAHQDTHAALKGGNDAETAPAESADPMTDDTQQGEKPQEKLTEQLKDVTALPPVAPSLRPSVAPADGGPSGHTPFGLTFMIHQLQLPWQSKWSCNSLL